MARYTTVYNDYPPNRDPNYRPCGINVSSNVTLEASNIDAVTGDVLPANYKRRRTQSDRIRLHEMEKVQESNRKKLEKESRKRGARISRKLGVLGPIVLALGLSLALLLTYAYGKGIEREIAKYRSVTADQNRINQEIQAKIDAALDEVNVVEQARELGMMPIVSAQSIEIDAEQFRDAANGIY